MLGILIQLLLSWLLLRFIERRNLEALGLLPTRRRLKDLAIGLLLPILYLSVLFLTLAWAGKNPWQFNDT